MSNVKLRTWLHLIVWVCAYYIIYKISLEVTWAYHLHDRPAAAPGIRDAKKRSVNDAICAKPEVTVAGSNSEKNWTKEFIRKKRN